MFILKPQRKNISSNVQVQVMGGRKLFETIQDLEIDGIVINWQVLPNLMDWHFQLINMALLSSISDANQTSIKNLDTADLPEQ